MISSIHSVTHGIGYFSLIPRIVRLCVFKWAVYPFSTFYERFILNRWQNHFSGHGFLGRAGNFDKARAENMVRCLFELGGEEHHIVPRDGEARLQVIKLTAASLREKIERLGGSWEKREGKIVIRQPKERSFEWNAFYQNLKRIFPQEQEDGLVTSTLGDMPFAKRGNKTECVLFARFGKSFVMNKSEIGYFLGKGIDVCLYDTRGILHSEGYPTEAGLYNDIDSVADFLIESYDPSKICIYGTCGESFTAMLLFSKYHSRGINMILENTPASLTQVLSKINRVAARLFGFFNNYIKAPSASRCRETPEDNFDSLAKLRALPQSNHAGYVVLAKTTGDEMASSDEIDEMARLMREKGNRVTVLENELSLDKKGLNDPHLAHPLRNPHLQEAFIHALFV